ncbi:MAG: ABC transporter ATP-binding protein [Deltaproteobacteria bacterium]|nr:ABC transporter ATP-binding protein [Deltaproteobacteria bacterium]
MIRIRNLSKVYDTRHGRVEAVRGINLDVAEHEFCVLLGPSGCGKTTTLRSVAGLEVPDDGEIDLGGQVVYSGPQAILVPPEKRDIGMVFQSYAVWPHMNVFQVVAYPLTDGRKRSPKHDVMPRVRGALELVQLRDLEDRPVTDLSGGQQQRVALARALVSEPRVLLMDEPLSNLDARLREQMRLELKKITRSVGVTTLYVTHDQAEALSLGDKVCVMHDGEILQVGSPKEVYSRPQSLFVAQFVGEMNFVRGRVRGRDEVDSPVGKVKCPVPPNCEAGREVTLAIRPEHLSLSSASGDGEGAVGGKILSKTYLGDSTLFEVEACGVALKVRLSGDSDFDVGEQAGVLFPPGRWRVYS